MAEHERVTHKKQADLDQHRTSKQEAQQSFGKFHAWSQGLLPLTETPFYPRIEEHAEILSRTPYSVHRHEFIMQLNNTYGLRYVQRLVNMVNARAKLTVSNPNDVYEKEADRVAKMVTRNINTPVKRQALGDDEEELLQGKLDIKRQTPEEEEELIQGTFDVQRLDEEELQMQEDESTLKTEAGDIETRINSAQGEGKPLSDEVREPMEQAFGADFSGVRIHIDSEADTLNRKLSARAFTTGQDIFFREGEYGPSSDSGRQLIAHELTHVVQQSGALQLDRDKSQVQMKPDLKSHLKERTIIQRHNMPQPDKLEAERITGTKRPWTVKDILGSDLDHLKEALKKIIPASAKPTPEERISSLVYTDCPTPDNMATLAGAENRSNAAKVTSSGAVFFNNSLDDYYKADGSPNMDKIKTTVVHESMHAISASHTGIQDYADLLTPGQKPVAQLQPDEAFTDYLSLQVYETVFGSMKPYITAYWVPASSNVMAASNDQVKELAREQKLPVLWTGEMVDIIEAVLGVDEAGLKDMYFQNPEAFGRAIKGKEDAIQEEWAKKMGESALAKGVLTAEYKPRLLDEVIRKKMAELARVSTPLDRQKIVIEEMRARSVPEPKKTRFGGGMEGLYSVGVVDKAWQPIFEAEKKKLPVELQSVPKIVTLDMVNEAIKKNKKDILEGLWKSDLFPLSVWNSDAYSTLLDWNSGI